MAAEGWREELGRLAARGPVWGEDIVVAPDCYGNDTTSVKILRKPSEVAVRLCEDLPSHSVQK